MLRGLRADGLSSRCFSMGAGLYDPAFATLGRLYGKGGRLAITALTLFGGFANTVCWPLSAFLETHLGWRGVCLTYAGIQLAVSLPLYLFGLPREPGHAVGSVNRAAQDGLSMTGPERGRAVFCNVLLASCLLLALRWPK